MGDGKTTKECFTADPMPYGLLKDYAKELRKNPTEAEVCLWQMLKGGFYGKKFRRQHIIAEFIADFACIESKLIIEIDGGYHSAAEQQERDAVREQRITHIGYKILRFSNEEVIADPQSVLKTIKESL